TQRSAGFFASATRGVAEDAGDPAHLVAGMEQAGVSVTDDGATWRTVDPGAPSIADVISSPVTAGRYLSRADDGVFKSEDGGRTWEPAHRANWTWGQPGALAFDPVDPATSYVASRVGDDGPIGQGLAITHDNGASSH